MTALVLGEVDRALSDAWATIQRIEDDWPNTDQTPDRRLGHQAANASAMALMPADGVPGILAKLRAAALFLERGDEIGARLILSATEDAAQLAGEHDGSQEGDPTPLAFSALWEQRRRALLHHRRQFEWNNLDGPDAPSEPETQSDEPDYGLQSAIALLCGLEDAVGALVPETVEQVGMQAAMALAWIREGLRVRAEGPGSDHRARHAVLRPGRPLASERAVRPQGPRGRPGLAGAPAGCRAMTGPGNCLLAGLDKAGGRSGSFDHVALMDRPPTLVQRQFGEGDTLLLL